MTHPSDDLVRPDTSPATSEPRDDEAATPAATEVVTEASAEPPAVPAGGESLSASPPVEPPTEATPAVERELAASEPQPDLVTEVTPAAETAPAEIAAPETAATVTAPAETTTPEIATAAASPPEVAATDETGGADEAGGTEPLPPPVPPEQLAAFNSLMVAFEKQEPVEGKVIGWNKGGFHVSLDGVPGFCPKSQIELGNPKKSSNYVGRDFRFKIIEVRDGGKRIVISRAAMLKEERHRLLKEVVVAGNVLDGTVSNVTDFGAFVDLGGVEGLVHLSKLSRRRIEHPRDLLKVGDQVKVRVLKVEKNGSRISLSMKDLEPDPWDSAGDRYPIGSRIEGTVLRAAEFGLFVEVEPGLEGLVHTSQLPLGKGMDDPSLAEGTTVSCWVRDVDGPRRRLSLAMREVASNDPWEGVSERYPEGAEVEGRVEQVAKFGLFVELEPGLSGLLPYSLMSLPEGTRPERTYAAGQPIAVQVSAIDAKRRRISLAPKGRQLEGTKADYKEYQKKQKQGSTRGLNAMAAAFARLQGEAQDQP